MKFTNVIERPLPKGKTVPSPSTTFVDAEDIAPKVQEQPSFDTNASSEQRIKDAARKVFLMKGFAGARVQEIADEAGMNRVLVNYYFRSKERLFQVVFQEAMSGIDKRLSVVVSSDVSIKDKITQVVEGYMTQAMIDPHVEVFLVNEFNQHPDLMRQVFQESRAAEAILGFVRELNEAHEREEIRYSGFQVFLTVMSTCMFPFVAQSMMQNVLGLAPDSYAALMRQRRNIAAEMIWRSIAP
jgi:AcrR family transcriptional regulator